MRLSQKQLEIIVDASKKVFGTDAKIWLFGSRVDDALCGGDIDLFIESEHDDPNEWLEF